MGNLPIGQGELVTPMQMVEAYAAVANGGILRPPHIISAIGGRPVPQQPGRRIISTATAAAVRQMLEGVLGPGGTASEVSIPGYKLAGKTGTASKIDPATGEYSHSAYVASFIGFAPASDPKLLCAVVVDEPQTGSIFGGTVAAPAFGQIMSFALPYMDIAPGQCSRPRSPAGPETTLTHRCPAGRRDEARAAARGSAGDRRRALPRTRPGSS